MTTAILHDFWRSSACYRVRIALNLKGVDWQPATVDLAAGDHADPAFKVINPQGFVPALEIDGHLLTQSLAIIDYLDATHKQPPMVSSDPAKRARTLAQALIIAADIHPINNLRVLKYLKLELGQDQPTVDRWYRHWIAEGFTALEAMAPESGLFGGSQPNLADVCLVPQMYNARRFEVPLEAYPKLVRIDAALTAMDPIARAAPEVVKPA